MNWRTKQMIKLLLKEDSQEFYGSKRDGIQVEQKKQKVIRFQ